MQAPLYTAEFAPDEDLALVRASLSCPRCLSAVTAWTLHLVPWDDGAQCDCRSCGHRWALAVSPAQALRLAIDPACHEYGGGAPPRYAPGPELPV